MFFPLAFTVICTNELCSIRDTISVYHDTHARVLCISVDSLFVLKQIKQEENLNFPLLSDFNKYATKAYGISHETFSAFEMQGISTRALFIIDKKGDLQHIEISATTGDLPDINAMQQVLNRLN